VLWVDFLAPDADELTLIADELALHELAVEDAIHAHQRPKLDRYSPDRWPPLPVALDSRQPGEPSVPDEVTLPSDM
jgi:hypothetical protein